VAKLQKVLVAYDGSPQSREALRWALYFSHHSKAKISAVKVYEPIVLERVKNEVGLMPENISRFEQMHEDEFKVLDEVKETAQKTGIEIATELLPGHVAETLLNYAKEHDIDMIFAGTRGHGTLKQMLLGSKARTIVSLAEVPVLIVKSGPKVLPDKDSSGDSALHNILVAYDGSTCSKEALNWAMILARRAGAQIHALKVREPIHLMEAYGLAESTLAIKMLDRLDDLERIDAVMLEEARELGKKEGLNISTHIADGNVVETLLDFAQKNAVEMVIAGARGHGVFNELLIGSVANNLISLSPVPVMVVKE